MLVIERCANWSRTTAKYHTLSLTTGPPIDPLRSQDLSRWLGATSPASLNACVVLSPCMPLLDPPAKIMPLVVLPPVFGTKFITGPLVSDSPSPPVVVMFTSSELPGSVIRPDVVPASDAPWGIPST